MLLPLQERETLIEAITDFLKQTWNSYDSGKIRDHFITLDTIVIGRRAGEVIFISGANWIRNTHTKHDIYRIGLTIVSAKYRGRGLMISVVGRLIVSALIRRFGRPFYVVLRTADTKVYGALVSIFGRVLPDYRDRHQPTGAERDIAKGFARNISPNNFFDADNFVVRGVFPHSEKTKPHHNKAIQSYFYSKLGEGDAFIVVVRANIQAAFRFAVKVLRNKYLLRYG